MQGVLHGLLGCCTGIIITEQPETARHRDAGHPCLQRLPQLLLRLPHRGLRKINGCGMKYKFKYNDV